MAKEITVDVWVAKHVSCVAYYATVVTCYSLDSKSKLDKTMGCLLGNGAIVDSAISELVLDITSFYFRSASCYGHILRDYLAIVSLNRQDLELYEQRRDRPSYSFPNLKSIVCSIVLNWVCNVLMDDSSDPKRENIFRLVIVQGDGKVDFRGSHIVIDHFEARTNDIVSAEEDHLYLEGDSIDPLSSKLCSTFMDLVHSWYCKEHVNDYASKRKEEQNANKKVTKSLALGIEETNEK